MTARSKPRRSRRARRPRTAATGASPLLNPAVSSQQTTRPSAFEDVAVIRARVGPLVRLDVRRLHYLRPLLELGDDFRLKRFRRAAAHFDALRRELRADIRLLQDDIRFAVQASDDFLRGAGRGIQ